jgi:hypothetical protein
MNPAIYRWGVYIAIGAASYSVLCSLIALGALFMDRMDWTTLAVSISAALVAIGSGFAARGLFERRRYGAVLYLTPFALGAFLGILGIILSFLFSSSPNVLRAFGFCLVISLYCAPYTAINFFYFKKRWADMA